MIHGCEFCGVSWSPIDIICPYCASVFCCSKCKNTEEILRLLKCGPDWNPDRREYYQKGYCREQHKSVELID